MDQIRICGGKPLVGTIPIGGAKNAALPLLAASLLTSKTLRLTNLPDLADITTMVHLLAELGVSVNMDGEVPNGGHVGRALSLSASEPKNKTAPYDLVRRMRASVLVLGPLLARWGEARVSLPGGCAIGTRPVDLHLDAFRALGAQIELEEGYIRAVARRGLKGNRVHFPSVSVGATENALMAAVLADGETIISNAAREPEVGDLAHCLIAMGARISGVGADTLSVTGVSRLDGAEHRVIPDRIETGTYAVAAAITGGNILLEGSHVGLIGAVLETLSKAGVEVIEEQSGIRVRRRSEYTVGTDVMTDPYPGFPTDMQAQLMALLSVSQGASMVTESIFENRFMLKLNFFDRESIFIHLFRKQMFACNMFFFQLCVS